MPSRWASKNADLKNADLKSADLKSADQLPNVSQLVAQTADFRKHNLQELQHDVMIIMRQDYGTILHALSKVACQRIQCLIPHMTIVFRVETPVHRSQFALPGGQQN